MEPSKFSIDWLRDVVPGCPFLIGVLLSPVLLSCAKSPISEVLICVRFAEVLICARFAEVLIGAAKEGGLICARSTDSRFCDVLGFKGSAIVGQRSPGS